MQTDHYTLYPTPIPLYNIFMAKSAPLFNIDLLHPQGESQKILVKLLGWLLSAGRYIIIFVEILVLSAFLARFKLDADIANVKEAVDLQIPVIESLKSEEALIRKIHFQLATIKNLRQGGTDYKISITKIANQTPAGVTLTTLSFEEEEGKVNIKMTGTALNNPELSTFVLGLKEDDFPDVSIASINLERGLINFSLTASIPKAGGEKSS